MSLENITILVPVDTVRQSDTVKNNTGKPSENIITKVALLLAFHWNNQPSSLHRLGLNGFEQI